MQKRTAFTLTEMLIVSAVIAIMAAILFPVLAASRERAHQVTCLNNLLQLHKAFMMYATDNDGLIPPYQNASSGGRGYIGHTPYIISASHSDLLVSALASYTHFEDIWFCPEDMDARTHRGSFGSDHFDTSYQAPAEMGLEGHPATASGYGVPFPIPQPFQTLLTDYDQRGYSHGGSFNRIYFDGHADSYRVVYHR